MTVAEMHEQLSIRVDERSSVRFTPDEVDAFLNRAQNSFVLERYRQFEAHEENRQSLALLVEVLPVPFVQTANTAIADLDALPMPASSTGSRPLFVLSLNVEVTDNCGRVKRRAVRPLHSNNEVHVTSDPFNKPSAREPMLHVEHDGLGARRLRLYVAGDNDVAPFPVVGPSTVRVLRSPRPVNIFTPVDSELPAYLHEEIVNRAVAYALENVGSARLSGHSLLSAEERP